MMTTKEIEKAVAEYFDWSYNFEVIDLITSVVESVVECKTSHDKHTPEEEFNSCEAICECIDSVLIYNHDLVVLASNGVINITINDGIFAVTGTDYFYNAIYSITNSLGVEL